MIAARVIRTTGSITTKRAEYYHRDALGSVEVITDALGRIVRRFHYLPFGERTDITAFAHLDPSYPTATGVAALVKRGYTGHEQLDEFGLIHMNGRVFDVRTARFTSADPHIQYATSTQNHNRYAYVQNNPLKYTDPSGYFLSKLWKSIKKNLRTIVAIAVVAFVPAAWGLVGTMLAGFTSGLIASGGDFRAGVWGALAGAAFYGVGSAMGDGHKFLSKAHLQKVVAHGGTGGLMSVAQGGKFGHGALASGFAQFAAPGIDMIGEGTAGMHVGRTAVASLVGGTASSLGGGKFANGAVTGAFSRAFNDEIHVQASFRAPRWLGRLIYGDDYIGQGVTVGAAVSYPGFSEGEFDAGGFIEIQGGGKDYGVGKATIGVGVGKGDVRGMAGRGSEISGHFSPLGGSINLDSSNRFSSVSVNFGKGYNLGGAGTITKTLSVRDAIDKWRGQ